MFKDYYSVLGISASSTGEQVRAAFKRLALQYHPDKTLNSTLRQTSSGGVDPTSTCAGDGGLSNASVIDTTQRFTEVQEAYEVLSDVARRYLYDMNYNELLAHQQRAREEETRRRQEWEQQQREQRERERQRLRQLVEHQQLQLLEKQQQERQEAERAATMARADQAAAATHNPTIHGSPFSMHPQDRTGDNMDAGTCGGSHKQQSSSSVSRTKPSKRNLPPLFHEDSSCADSVPIANTTTTAQEASSPPLSRAPRENAPSTVERGTPVPSSDSAARTGKQRRSCSSRFRTGYRRKVDNADATIPAVRVLRRSVGSSTSSSLPSLRMGNSVSLSLDSSLQLNCPTRRGYPLPTPESEGLPADYYYRRSIERTLRIFFAEELSGDA